ncbi:MAG TPA: NADH-quinone oxidoreductase subunit N [Actinomycetota bacterium]|nr:NADH-quinone oxidoreductase subunit N [Actinomycetota bacterium]
MQIDLIAIGPEIILTAALCGVLLLDLFLPDNRKWLAMPASFAGVLATLAAVLYIAMTHERSTLGGMFVVDSFAILFKAVFCLAALLVFTISHDYLKEDTIHQGEYYVMLLSSLLGMLVISSSRDLIAIFVALELISLPAFVLAGLRKSDLRSNEAALKFFLFGVLSTAVMLFGMSLIYGITGTTNLADIATVISVATPLRDVAILSVFFLLVGIGFKISAFPFQWWVPDTYEGSPVPVAAFLSVASKTAGFVALIQIMFVAFIQLADQWRPFLAILAVLTMTFGNLVALKQKHLVRLLAYSSIAQAGYILLPLGIASATNQSRNREAFIAATVYLLIYAFMETGAFAVAIAVGRRGRGYQISDYAGLMKQAPGLVLAMAIFLFSLAGVPPMAGWAAKFFIFRAVLNAGGIWLAIAMAVNTVIALFYYAAVAKKMVFDEPAPGKVAFGTPPLLGTAITLAAIVVVVVGILPDLFGRLAEASALF